MAKPDAGCIFRCFSKKSWITHMYCEVEKKNGTVCVLDIFIGYKSYLKIFMVDVNTTHKFLSTKFHRRHFDACRIFYENLIFCTCGKRLQNDTRKMRFFSEYGDYTSKIFNFSEKNL